MAQPEETAPERVPAWRISEGFLRSQTAQLAIALLSDPTLESDFTFILEAIGITSGPLWELGKMGLLSLNGEEHRRYRGTIAHHFTPTAVERCRETAVTAASELASPLARTTQSEIIESFAEPFVRRVSGHFTGLTDEQIASVWPQVMGVARASRHLPAQGPQMVRAMTEMATAARDVLDGSTPGRDTVIAELRLLVEDGDLPNDVAVSLIAALFSAGFEPPVNQLGLIVELLADHPDVWDGLGTGRLSAPRVIEECIRLRSTNAGTIRRVTCPADHGDRNLEAGSLIMVGLDEANHDPDRFPCPGELQLDRQNNRSHLAFGFGPHHCLGAALARLLMEEGLRALAKTITAIRVDRSVDEGTTGLRGPTELHLTYQARPSA